MSKRGLLAILVALLSLGPCEAWACVCLGGLLFDDNVKQSDLVLLGRVKAQGTQLLPSSNQPEVVYLDLEVIKSYKGMPRKPMVRLWDSYVGTDCGGGLAELTPGEVVGFVVNENKAPYSVPDVWKFTKIQPGTSDYLIGTCSEDWKVFRTEIGARLHMARLVH
jgi:hypothetical protein